MPLTGYSADLPSDILLDTGVLYIGSVVLGATRGAPRFDPGKQFSNIDFDGKRADIMGLDRVDRHEAMISCTLVEFDAADIAVLEPGSTSAGTTVVLHTPKRAGTLLAAADYISDLRLVFERGVTPSTYAAILFPRALVTRYQVAGNKNDIGLIEAEFRARLNMATANIGDAPYQIELRDALP